MTDVQKLQTDVEHLKKQSDWLTEQLAQSCAAQTAYEMLFNIGVIQQGPTAIRLFIESTRRLATSLPEIVSGLDEYEDEQFTADVQAKIGTFRKQMDEALVAWEREKILKKERDQYHVPT